MADSKTYREVLDKIDIVIGEWIETSKVLGREIPEPKRKWYPNVM